ncbi:hypothetical protein [Methylobacterium sp. J-070]|uniref:baeRF11 domain-containing protein n=1 Tax=Methylobacterium sp. J-070 TaxID=2836650 RepID=UPI001FB9B144|nr:hypothetical protein [Methylobacterium sp. J-070]MCJ2054312.1 hypothetical protein [Methylobacterium sp. J-070]
MMRADIPGLQEFKALATARGGVFVSLYLPTSPLHPDANRIAFKDLAKDAIAQMRDGAVSERVIDSFERQFGALSGRIQESLDDNKHRLNSADPLEQVEEFWKSQAHGLGVLARSETNSLQTYRLPIRPLPLAEVADRFHLAPLIRTITSPLEIFVLAISAGGARLLHVVVNMPPARVPVAHLSDDPAETLDRPSIHVKAPRRRLQNREGQKILEAEYARTVHDAVREALAGRSTPMVLAAAEPMLSIYRAVNTYPHLIAEAIEGAPDHRSDAQLGDAALPILDRLYRNEVTGVLALYDALKPYRATSDVSRTAHAATAAAVDRLVVDLDRVIPGLVSDVDGSVTYSVSDDAETYSVLDEVARRALCTDARVLCARRAELPAGCALAAILRYAF